MPWTQAQCSAGSIGWPFCYQITNSHNLQQGPVNCVSTVKFRVVFVTGVSRVSRSSRVSWVSSTFQENFKRQQELSSVSRVSRACFKRAWIWFTFLNWFGVSSVSSVSRVSRVSRVSSTFQEHFKRIEEIARVIKCFKSFKSGFKEWLTNHDWICQSNFYGALQVKNSFHGLSGKSKPESRRESPRVVFYAVRCYSTTVLASTWALQSTTMQY